MTTLTEQQLEDKLINQLIQNDYERAMIPNVLRFKLTSENK